MLVQNRVYGFNVNSLPPRRACHFLWLYLLGFCFLSWSTVAQDKPIRLRNETILPSLPQAPVAPLAAALAPPPNQDSEPQTGLFLIQFQSHLNAEWKPILAGMGVQLLQYVPEDAFIAKLDHVAPADLRRLAFVRWVGAYRLDHKIHSAVRKWWEQAQETDARPLTFLLAGSANATERTTLQGAFAGLDHQTRHSFGEVWRGRVLKKQFLKLLQSPAVLWVEPAPHPKLNDEISAEIVAGSGGANRTQMQKLGFDGTGVTVAVADSGLDTGTLNNLHPDIAGRVRKFFWYGDLTDASDGHSHGTHVTGIIGGSGATGEKDEAGFLYGLGVAPNVQIITQRIFDDTGGYQAPPSYEALTHDAVRAGADIGSNSWGDDTQGQYDTSAAEFDALVRDADKDVPGDQPYILEFSAGNAGPGQQTIGSPAVGKNVIASGASQNNRPDFFLYADGIDAMADFSSRGPCEDGRIKPDVVAPGTWISSMKSRLASDENAWAGISDNYIYQGGTSQAGPHVSGAAAVFVQYYKTITKVKPSPALVKAALINSAVDMDDGNATPNNDEGWGRIDLTRLIGSDTRRYDFVDQTTNLTVGAVYERRVLVTDDQQELKITLAYTDVPGFPGALPALVNDLDLEVISPTGEIFRGNQFFDGESIPNPSDSDHVNNVEGVHLYAPVPGEYRIHVIAVNIAQDARVETPALDQDFALVISGSLPPPGLSTVLLDRHFYSAPSQIRVVVLDPDIPAGQSTVSALVSSTTETHPENLLLVRSGASSLFTGVVATVTGPAVTDGRLQIRNADSIQVTYPKSTGALDRTAVADLVAPQITSVSAAPDLSRVVITWNTDEPANSMVVFGLSGPDTVEKDNARTLNHEVTLSGLRSDTTYNYFLVSMDEAGNVRTNNNQGSFFQFRTPKRKTVLLVDAYIPDDLLGSPVIDLSVMTSALDATGVSYDVWTRSERPEIQLSDLKPYRVVWWRINDAYFFTSIASSEVTTLAKYVGQGGSFFMATMEGLSRFASTTFNQAVAHVSDFTEDVGCTEVVGLDGDPVSSGVDYPMDYSNYQDSSEFGGPPADISDHITPTSNAIAFLFDAATSEPVGVRFPNSVSTNYHGRSVFLSVPFDAISTVGPGPSAKEALLRNILAYLAPGADGLGAVRFDQDAYSLPSRVVVEVGDSDLAGTSTLGVKVTTTTEPQGLTLVLKETPEEGVFRGEFTLVPTTGKSGPTRLRAAEGDDVKVEYFDASAQSKVFAFAKVDTSAPNVNTPPEVDPNYEQATVTWSTSEPSDSLVQFGETPLLGRTAFEGLLDVDHQVTLVGLAPDRLYYFRIVSRDSAGNATVDDNHGAMFTFHTATPGALPWLDDMEAADTQWQVFDSDGSVGTWSRGTPNNGLETAAHSPVNAWGTSLNGGVLSEFESILMSPAFFIGGGNKITLRFWHSYDFNLQGELDIFNSGEVLLITNLLTTPVTLLSLAEEQSTWTEETFDLTPYAGHVAYIAFHAAVFSLDEIPRPGWLVDDVSVVAENVEAATVVVTNNLSQAKFTITGPVTRSGQGNFFKDANMPAGQYVISFSNVPFYQAPGPQTNTVELNQTLVFQGNYTFPDVNQNGLSDLWERQYFGTVGNNHPATQDSDQDGMSDLAEFYAGTNPTQAESLLKMLPPSLDEQGHVSLSWTSLAGRGYRILETQDWVQWTPVTDWVLATSATTTLQVPDNASAQSRYYRLEVRP